jgi:hypothetical protein
MPSEHEDATIGLRMQVFELIRERQEITDRLDRERVACAGLIEQWHHRFNVQCEITQERERELAGLRQLLIALRIQLKADGREKWSNAIDRITEVVGV